jgi:hypothetical protein
MRGFLILVVLLLVGLVGLGFYRGWFQLSTDSTEHKAHTTLTVDQDKIQEDKEKVQEFGHQAKEKTGERIDQGK